MNNTAAKYVVDAARTRERQDHILDEFGNVWSSLDPSERRKLPYKIVKAADGTVTIKDRSNRLIAEIELVCEDVRRVRWVRSLDDLKRIADIAGVK